MKLVGVLLIGAWAVCSGLAKEEVKTAGDDDAALTIEDVEDKYFVAPRSTKGDTGLLLQNGRDDRPHAEQFLSAKGFLSALGGGLEAARGVAELVSKSFAKEMPPKAPQMSPDLLAGFFKLLGFNNSKLGAIAVNAVIFIAQLIGSSLATGEQENAKEPAGTPLSWFFSNMPNKVGDLLAMAQERSLPDRLIEGLRESSPVETDCVQLLVCKVGPFMWAMQAALGHEPTQPDEGLRWSSMSPLQRMFAHMPSMENLSDHGTDCEMKYPSCRIRFD